MELNEFVKLTLTQILSGVNDASGNEVALIGDGKSNPQYTKNVNFFLTISSKSDEAGLILVDTANGNVAKKQHLTRLEFSIPIIFQKIN